MHRGLAALLPLFLLTASAQAHPAGDPFPVGNPRYVNFLLDGFATPDLAPGESGDMHFTFRNTYPWRMTNVSLMLEVYVYLEKDVELPVDAATWPHDRPAFRDPLDSTGREHRLAFAPLIPDLAPRQSENVTLIVVTDTGIPHGTLTKQGSYFVRTRLAFDLTYNGTTSRSFMFSRGYYTNAEFDTARLPYKEACPSWAYCEGLLNMTYLGAAQDVVSGLNHSDGLTPETGFSVRDRMPLWPFVAVGGIMAGSLVFAFLSHAEENPGKFPRTAQWWLGLKGRVRQVRPPRSK